MPHDKNDHPLAEGDLVNVRYVIQRIFETDTGACNVTLKTVHARKHDQNHEAITTASSLCEYLSSLVPEPIATHPLDNLQPGESISMTLTPAGEESE
jgi:hypothetical protein